MIDLYNTIEEHPEYFRQLKCKDLLFTQYDCPQENLKEQLFSEHNYIAYVISGKRTFYLPGEVHTMDSDKCVFAKKGAWTAEKEPAAGWCVLVFFLPDSYLKQFIGEHRSSLPAVRQSTSDFSMLNLNLNELTRRFFHSMKPYFEKTASIPESLLELKFKELLLNVLINPANESLLSWLYTLADGRDPLQPVMESNYTFNLSMLDFAKIANRSLATFKRDFKSVYHTTPGKWLTRKRLDHATILLVTSSQTISEITFNSGFENATHFSRLFKAKFGMTPSAYRLKHELKTPEPHSTVIAPYSILLIKLILLLACAINFI